MYILAEKPNQPKEAGTESHPERPFIMGWPKEKSHAGEWLPVVVVLLMIGALAVVPQARAEDVGKFSRVVNQVEQLKKGQEPALTAKVPNGVENHDVVRTKEQAMAVVLFVDESTITISPKSKVTIEDYLYDAGKGQAKGSIKLLEGVVETVIPASDRLQQRDLQIRTTTAIAGIRG